MPRARWRQQQRHLLLDGHMDQVITAVQAICRGRHSKAIGSGAIESTVRRVVNLRLKGPSLFWCRAHAEAILLLRSY